MADIVGTTGHDTILGTDFADKISGGAGNDKIASGKGADVVYGDDGNDNINAGADNDIVFGGLGNDTLTGDSGDDQLFGEDGNDGFFGGGGNDIIDGGIGNDVVFGDGANDLISGGAGNDILSGGTGNDTLSGGSGNDTMSGDAGDDTFVIRPGEGIDTINGGLGIDTVVLDLTAADMTSTMVAELKAYDAWSKSQLASAGGDIKVLASQTTGATFNFATLGATISAEALSIKVDGSTAQLGLIINDAPTADSAVAQSTDEDTALNGQITASDPNSDAVLSYAASTGPSHGTLSLNASTGAFVYTPAADYNGADSFTVTVTDQWGASTAQTVNITVSPVNDAPASAPASTASASEDNAASGTVLASDVDGDALTFSVSGAAAHGTASIDSKTGAYIYTPDANYNGSDSFTVTVEDPTGASVTQTVNVTITPVNDAPTVDASASVSVNEDATLNGTVLASDIEGDALTFSIASGAANGTVSIDSKTGAYTYTPVANYNGSDSFTVTVQDTSGASSTQTVSVTVTPVNDAPVTASASSASGSEDNAVSGTVLASDIDGDGLTFSVSGAASHGSVTIDSKTGAYIYTPASNYSGSDSFTVTVEDLAGATAVQTVTVAVSAIADAPLITAADISVSASVSLSGTTGNDTLLGGSGDDVLLGGGGNDILNGAGPRNLTIALGISAALADTDGSETLSSIVIAGLGASSTLSAGTKNVDGSWTLTAAQLSGLTVTTPDTADLTLTITASATEAAGGSASTKITQNIAIARGTNADIIDGGSGNDSINGGSGNNVLTGGSGNDSVFGGAGNDLFMAGLGNDIYDGGSGSDTLNYTTATSAITVDLLAGTASGMGTDIVLNFENVIGSDFSDKITGSNSDGYFDGGKGNDTINGGGGNDTILGGEGNDNIRGGGGNDTISGGSGNDTLRGDGGDDKFLASAGNDSYRGDTGTDTLDYSSAASAISVDAGAGTISGWGNDTITTIEKIIGTNFGDTFVGSTKKTDTFDGGGGDDSFLGLTGSDVFTGGAGSDTFIWRTTDYGGGGGAGVDSITDFTVGTDHLDLSSFTDALPSSPVSSVITVTDTVTGTVIAAKVGSTFYNVVTLEGIHGVSLSAMLSDGSILA